MKNKVKSFTLSELLVAMIITVIVVGLAFTVLNLVKKQIIFIQDNYNKTNEFALFKQSIWLDFNRNNTVFFNLNEKKIIFKSATDSIYYTISDDFVLRNKDTLNVNINIEKLLFQGNEVSQGNIDGISLVENKEGIDSHFFVFKKNDATLFMNQDGF